MNTLLDSLPLWGVFIATVVLILLSLEGGHRLGDSRRRRSGEEKAPAVGAIVGARLSLLAFMLTFTFGLAASRFDARRQLLIDEANAIETAYLRSELLQEPHRTELRRLFLEYVNVRLEGVRLEMVDQAVRRSGELHRRLWKQAVALGGENARPVVAGLFIQSLNDVIDLHSRRVMAAGIPGIIWTVLYFVAIVSMAGMGYQSGLSGSSRSLANIGLVLSYSAVLYLIADLDRPEEGMLTVSRQVLVDLRNTMHLPEP
ncbi:MAG: hypothetical protein H0T48_00945 [Gemmatimonadaceae bacterium]|nr:hypothetical protein [Gemmatimonadaceae bacterium]